MIRAGVDPSMEAAGKTSCFSRPRRHIISRGRLVCSAISAILDAHEGFVEACVDSSLAFSVFVAAYGDFPHTSQKLTVKCDTTAPTLPTLGVRFRMPKVTFISFTGGVYEVDAPLGTTLMRAATDNRIPGIDGDCGGNCACATCHIYVDPAWSERLAARSATEEDMLNCVAELRDSSRLACQITLTDGLNGLVVRLPEAQH